MNSFYTGSSSSCNFSTNVCGRSDCSLVFLNMGFYRPLDKATFARLRILILSINKLAKIHCSQSLAGQGQFLPSWSIVYLSLSNSNHFVPNSFARFANSFPAFLPYQHVHFWKFGNVKKLKRILLFKCLLFSLNCHYMVLISLTRIVLGLELSFAYNNSITF